MSGTGAALGLLSPLNPLNLQSLLSPLNLQSLPNRRNPLSPPNPSSLPTSLRLLRAQ